MILKKTILFLGAGIEQAIAIKLAKKMHLKVIAFDQNPSAVGLKVADIGLKVDISDPDKVIRKAKKYNIDGVCTHGVEIPQVVSTVARAMNLPGLDPVIAKNATNKLIRAKVFKKNNIGYPKFDSARSLKQALIRAQNISYPLVIKPVDNSGARGVKKVNDKKELTNSFEEIISQSKNRRIIIEQFLEGFQVSTESFIFDNKIITTGFADRNYSRLDEFAPYFVEDGHNVPSILPAKTKIKILKTVEKSIKALGINWGVAKGDVLINRRGKIYILEMATRTSGGWFAAGTVPIATGINILKPLIKITVGDKPTDNDFEQKFDKAACQRYIIPFKEGIFKKFEGIQIAKKMPGVVKLDIFKKVTKGAQVYRAKSNGDRFGHLIAEGRTLKESVERAERARDKINIILS